MATRVYTLGNPIPAWMPHEYVLKSTETKSDLPTEDVPAGSIGYKGDLSLFCIYDGEAWQEVEQ